MSRYKISQFQELFEIGGLWEELIGTEYSGELALSQVVWTN